MNSTELQKEWAFTDGQIKKFADLGNSLLEVHRRLLMEGYTISEGTITPPRYDSVKEVQ